MEQFDKSKIKTLPLSQRQNKSDIEKIIINPDSQPKELSPEKQELVEKIAQQIIESKRNHKPIILAFGAHLIKNGMGLVLREMIERGYLTHLATNGAGSIHDWEFAFQGKSEEDVEKYVALGQFGTWEETGKYINLALIAGALQGKGYGESIAELIHSDELKIPDISSGELEKKLRASNLQPGLIQINHLFKRYSYQDAVFANKTRFTIHPGFGYDIIYTHPLNDGASIGKCCEIDFLKFVDSVYHLEGGVYLSVGSAIMSPMIFEKALSMARNLRKQENQQIKDFMIIVNDIQEGTWDWNSKTEPNKTNPAYYLRFCKSFKRMGAREMHYLQADNRDFILNLYHALRRLDK